MAVNLFKKIKWNIIIAIIIMFLILPILPWRYLIHVLTLIFIFASASTYWSFMGRFGLVSLGHGAFFGLGAYTSSLLFNIYGLSPWIGMFIGGVFATSIAVIVGYPCFRYGVRGAYFSLVTLALSAAMMYTFSAMRGITGGLLGLTIRYEPGLLQFQFPEKYYYCYIAISFWLLSIYIWRRIEGGTFIYALKAMSDDEIFAEHSGIDLCKVKLQITMLSSFFTAICGTIYAQAISYINPEIAGITWSLEIAFIAILGGLYSMVGPLIGSAVYISFSEFVRVLLGSTLVGISHLMLGLLLIVFTIFLPGGIWGSIRTILFRRM